MTETNNHTIPEVVTRWDRDGLGDTGDRWRGLLVDIYAPELTRPVAERPPLNLALVLDRSGSMTGERLAAAQQAALGIVDALSDGERLSLVSFDNEVDIVFENLAIGSDTRARMREGIRGLTARGATDLAAGWQAGARCAAHGLEAVAVVEGRVLILSDGHANRGLVDPERLALHAGELAARGVRTSAVGIGSGYSPLQLDALADAGEGRLHDAETSEDIVDVVLGELGELRQSVARSARLEVRVPAGVRAEALTRSAPVAEGGVLEIPVGGLRSGQRRQIALRFRLPAGCEELAVGAKLSWEDPETGERNSLAVPVPQLWAGDAAGGFRDFEVVAEIASLWEASLAYRSMRLNEDGAFEEAAHLVRRALSDFERWVDGLDDARQRIQRLQRTLRAVSRRWEGRSKRYAYTLSKSMMMQERDLRSRDVGEWHEHVGD